VYFRNTTTCIPAMACRKAKLAFYSVLLVVRSKRVLEISMFQ
jgi:hypothetical protein